MSGYTAAASIALAAVGTGLSVKGQIDGQAAAGAQQAYMGQLARQRQQLAEQQARDAILRGQVGEQKQRDIMAQRIGTQTAALAAQGTDLEGSPIDILGDTARAGEQDALTIRSNAPALDGRTGGVTAITRAGDCTSFDRISATNWPGFFFGVSLGLSMVSSERTMRVAAKFFSTSA